MPGYWQASNLIHTLAVLKDESGCRKNSPRESNVEMAFKAVKKNPNKHDKYVTVIGL